MFLASKYEQLAQWISEQSPWIKYTLGTGLLVGTAVGVTAYTIAIGGVNPHAWLAVAGAIAGAVGGGIEASLAGGDFSDVILSAGMGAAFGAICPPGAIGGLIAGGGAALGAYALGGDRNTVATAYQWGSLVGGLAGDFTGGALASGRFLTTRALRAGLTHVGPDLLGAGVGAIIGYSLGGNSTSALHGATLGMMAGGIAGGVAKARGQWGVRRATNVPSRGINRGLEKIVWGLEGRGVETFSFRDLSSGAKRLVHQLTDADRAFVGSGVHIDDLRQASLYLTRELGVVLDRKGRLAVIKGTLDRLPPRPGDRFLAHTHPVFDTRPTDFSEIDIPNASDAVEAVIDWGGTITYFNRTGILQDLSGFAGPINRFGYVTGR